MSYNKEKYCGEWCEAAHDPIGLCDFCFYYNFNANEDGAYTGEGFCNYHNQPEEPYGGCEKFICKGSINNADKI